MKGFLLSFYFLMYGCVMYSLNESSDVMEKGETEIVITPGILIPQTEIFELGSKARYGIGHNTDLGIGFRTLFPFAGEIYSDFKYQFLKTNYRASFLMGGSFGRFYISDAGSIKFETGLYSLHHALIFGNTNFYLAGRAIVPLNNYTSSFYSEPIFGISIGGIIGNKFGIKQEFSYLYFSKSRIFQPVICFSFYKR
jgi:hypothetical protein